MSPSIQQWSGLKLERLGATGGLGVITLQNPKALNALNLEMVQGLAATLKAWAKDPSVRAVALAGEGDRAFCAGGDVKRVVQESAQGNIRYALDFFEAEYFTDYAIHTFPKPTIVFGHGIVMGGGLGLLAGAKHRVLTPETQMAMPEISIGLYPEVGATYFLSRLPGRLGLFLGMTATRWNARDALDLGLGDVVVKRESITEILKDLARSPLDSESIERCLGSYKTAGRDDGPNSAGALAPGLLSARHEEVEAVCQGDTLFDVARNLRKAADRQSDGGTSEWLRDAAKTFVDGCPTSAGIIWETWNRGRTLSLADCFRLEMILSVQCCLHPNFLEGVRARLIDKDLKPRWQPATLEAVSPGWVAAHFAPPWGDKAHPLSGLENWAH